jgi:lysophospholipid acyltransferase (LPLAT)-like uncharacterized protein
MAQSRALKNALRSRAAGQVASAAISAYIRLVAGSSKIDFLGREHGDLLMASEKGVILAFWHGRLLMGPIVRRETTRPVHMLISAHRDGEIIASAVRGFGLEMIRGSAADPKKPEKNKSGAPAVAAMVEALSQGSIVGMTPDGPRGPRERAKIGPIKLAEMTGCPILPASYSASLGWRLNSWDRFMLAAPFSRIVFAARPPIHVERGASGEALEAARQRLEAELNAASAAADEAAGRENGE